MCQVYNVSFFSEVPPLVSTSCSTCASWVLSHRSHIPFGDVIVLMLSWHVLWPCVMSLQSSLSGIMPDACSPLWFDTYCGKMCIIARAFGKIILRWTVGFNKVWKKSFKHLVLSLGLEIFWSLVLWIISEPWGEFDVRRLFILWERKCNVTPMYCLYPLFPALTPLYWNSPKLFHGSIPLAMTQVSCHVVEYVSCIYNNPCRNTITIPYLDPTCEIVCVCVSISTGHWLRRL